MSQATPRKFSEKIAILERKQNEEQEQFNNVMRDVRTITSTNTPSRASSAANSPLFMAPSSVGSGEQPPQRQSTPQPSPQHQPQQPLNYGAPPSNDSSCGSKLSPEGPHPLTTNWNRAGGSLPNVHQMVQHPMGGSGPAGAPYGGCGWSPSWTNVPAATSAQQQVQQHVRTRSPGAPHFHPYRNGQVATVEGRHELQQQQRMSHGETSSRTSMAGIMGGVHLQPPDPTWSKARSDPAIHTAAMMSATAIDASGFMSAYPFYPGQNSTTSGHQQVFNGPATAPTSAAIMPNAAMPLAFFPAYPSPMLMGQTASQNTTLSTTTMTQQQQQQQQQQIYMQTLSGAPQLGSPSSSALSSSQMAATGMKGSSNNQYSQMNNFSQYQNCNTNQNPNQQQMMSNTRSYQQQPPPHYNNYISSGMIPPPLYQQQPAPQQQQQVGMNQVQQQMMANNAHHYHPQQQQQLTTPSIPIGLLNQSQSAPTSPTTTAILGQPSCSNSMMENPLAIDNRQQQQQWPPHRHFSASPDGLEVPNICVTGTDGSLDVDCFQDLQDLHLDNETLQMLKDPSEHEQMVDPACETQLLS